MMERLVKLFKKQITITLCAIICGFIVVAVILACTGYQPLEAFIILFQGIFSKPKYIVNVIVKATPIILTGLSVVFAFKVGLFNIGAEGEYIIGTIVATVVGILVDLPFILLFPLIVLSGVAAGALYGALIGFLKAKFGIHEVITGIMLNWIACYGSNFIVTLDRFHKPDSALSLIHISPGEHAHALVHVVPPEQEAAATRESAPMVRNLLGCFLFRGDDVQMCIRDSHYGHQCGGVQDDAGHIGQGKGHPGLHHGVQMGFTRFLRLLSLIHI